MMYTARILFRYGCCFFLCIAEDDERGECVKCLKFVCSEGACTFCRTGLGSGRFVKSSGTTR
jgi:hypothetical protein